MKCVLLIEDEADTRSTLAEFLTGAGWRVLQADDGDVGLTLAHRHRPDVVICDLLMPRCNGFQVCRAIRQQPRLGHTKIIVITGKEESDRHEALAAGANEYLLKPLSLPRLARMLAQVAPPATGQGASLPEDRPEECVSSAGARIKFWGVRGSIPTPGPGTVHYGGNTSCIEVRADDELIVLDSGSGIRPLGLSLVKEFGAHPIKLTLLISHTHWDHIQGFPFFVPAYDSKNHIRILGYEGSREGLRATLSSQMESPYFPVGMSQMPGHIRIEELKELNFDIGRVHVEAAFMNHPGICVGYRLNTSAGAIAYVPDNEPFHPRRTAHHPQSGSTGDTRRFMKEKERKLTAFLHDAEVLILDAQYDDVEYKNHLGWGHGSTQAAVDLAVRAKVKKLFLFHHDPLNDDAKITHMVEHARFQAARLGNGLEVDAAREGVEVILPSIRHSKKA
ncbi:MAG: response regulator [Verrucomicrobia bacterium]|nr:response regulator [Verrucomicrobiota bacterium]